MMNDNRAAVRRWSHLMFRATATAAAVLAAGQPVLAGGFLQGHYPMLAAHSAAASVLTLAVLWAALCGGLWWRPGRGPGRPAALCAVAVLLCGVQVGLGYPRELIIHVPLGVVLVGLVIQIAVLSWQLPLQPRKAVTDGHPATGAAAVRA